MGGTSLVGELTDKSIGQACQDWLKLAKQRYMNNSNKWIVHNYLNEYF